MRVTGSLLLCGVLILTYGAKTSIGEDLLSDVLGDVKRLNQQIHETVNSEVTRAKQIAEDAIKQATEETGKIGKKGHSGNTHSVQSGKDSKGRPYYIETDDVVVGGKLYHTERVYNHTTKKFDEYKKVTNLREKRKRKKRSQKRRSESYKSSRRFTRRDRS